MQSCSVFGVDFKADNRRFWIFKQLKRNKRRRAYIWLILSAIFDPRLIINDDLSHCIFLKLNNLLYLHIFNLFFLLDKYPAYVLLRYLWHLAIDTNWVYVAMRAFCGNYVFTEKVEFAVKQLVLLDWEDFLREEFAFGVEKQGVNWSIPVNLVDPFLSKKCIIRN